MDLVSKADARAQLRLDEVDSSGGPDDLWLDIWIPAISAAVQAWLKDEWRLYVPLQDSAGDVILDSSGDPEPSTVIKPQVRAAVLIELASQYRFREGEGDNAVPEHEGHGYALSKGATSLLASARRSTVA